ncbi:hypothetical protein Bca4012_015540 [Brassica carinata]
MAEREVARANAMIDTEKKAVDEGNIKMTLEKDDVGKVEAVDEGNIQVEKDETEGKVEVSSEMEEGQLKGKGKVEEEEDVTVQGEKLPKKKEGMEALRQKRKNWEDNKKKRSSDRASRNAEIKAKEKEANENLNNARQIQGCDFEFDQSYINQLKKDAAAARSHRK